MKTKEILKLKGKPNWVLLLLGQLAKLWVSNSERGKSNKNTFF